MPRPRKTNAQKELTGTDRKDRRRDEAEFPETETIEPPDWLVDPVAVDEWTTRVKHLKSARVLTDADLVMLAHYCNLHSRMVKKWRADMTPTGTEFKEIRYFAGQFGFTPATRHLPGTTEKEPDPSSPFAKLRAMR